MTNTTAPLSGYRIWIHAARPKTLWASIAPVIIAGALAFGDEAFHLTSFLAALCGGALLQIGSNFANDLFDYVKAVDTSERLGPLRVTQAGLVTPRQMRNATIIVFALAFLTGIYLVTRGGLPIAIIGVLSIVCGVLYTAGPYPLGYVGLGEVFVLIFFGFVPVSGAYYAMTLQIHSQVILAGAAPGLLSVAILVVNNLRDIDTDRKSGKRTLAVRFGRPFAQGEYVVAVVVALLYPLIHYFLFRSHASSMIAILTAFAAIPLIKTVLTTPDGARLNDTLAATGRLLLLYGICFSLGWLL